MTPPPEKREESWDYVYLAKKYDELIMAGEGLGDEPSTCKKDCQTLQDSVFEHQKENEELKVKNDSLEVRIQELQEIFSALDHPSENDSGREALEYAMQTNEELIRKRDDLQRERDDLAGQRDDWQYTVSVRDSEITDHLATIDELETKLGAAMERVHQYEFRDNPDTSEGGEGTILSLPNRTVDLHL
jgi:chromosome segregation ATPase